MDAPYIGAIFIWAGNFAPQGYRFCDGSQLSVQQNAALFAILGTNYGGNGSTTFNLPDLRGRFPFPAANPSQPGQVGGNAAITLGINNLPLHNHPATFTPTGGGAVTPLNVTTDLSVSTAAASTPTPTLANGDTAYLANAAAGASSNALKGLYTKTAPTTGGIATIPANTTVTGGGGGITGGTVAIGGTGANLPIDIHPPYLSLNFIIAVQGLFPPRN
ncbi:MAG: tail fiber protein [Methylococcaceae bacterium]|nr:tail fiber protein [Methylococcaceae bacterium]